MEGASPGVSGGTSEDVRKAAGRFFYGWWVVVGCALVVGASLVAVNVFPAIFPLMGPEFGWTPADLGKVVTVFTWIITFSGPLGGMMIDRVGARWTFAAGGVLIAVGLAGLASIRSFMQALIWYGFIVALGVALQALPLGAAVTRRWFFKRAGLAIGAMSSGSWVALAVLIPVLTVLAATYGWRPTVLWLGVALEAAVVCYAVLVIREYPASLGLRPDGLADAAAEIGESEVVAADSLGVSEAVKTRQFWLLTTAMCLTFLTMASFQANLPTIAVRLGASPAQGGTYISALAVAAAVGAWLAGSVGDRFGKGRVSRIGSLVGAVIFLVSILVVDDTLSLLALTLVFGLLLVQIPFVLVPALFGDLFGVARLGTIMTLAGLIQGAVSGFGPTVVGALADATGSYGLPMAVFAVCYLLSAVVISFLRPTRLGIPVR